MGKYGLTKRILLITVFTFSIPRAATTDQTVPAKQSRPTLLASHAKNGPLNPNPTQQGQENSEESLDNLETFLNNVANNVDRNDESVTLSTVLLSRDITTGDEKGHETKILGKLDTLEQKVDKMHIELLKLQSMLSHLLNASGVKWTEPTESTTRPTPQVNTTERTSAQTLPSYQANIVAATENHTSTIIFLHGMGDTEYRWAGLLSKIAPSHVKLICPMAEVVPVSLFDGRSLASWFDVYSTDPNDPQDELGLNAANETIARIIESEIAGGIPASRIILGGFSQGGALAFYTGLSSTYKFAGLVGLSTWIPLHKEFHNWGVNQGLAILQCHGDADMNVPYSAGLFSAGILTTIDTSEFTFNTYPGLEHTISEAELNDIGRFFKEKLPPI